MNLAQDQHVAGLSDVLRGYTPMCPAAMRFAYYPAQLDDPTASMDDSSRDPFTDPVEIKPSILHCRAMASAALARNHFKIGLGQRKRGSTVSHARHRSPFLRSARIPASGARDA
jgi:hypothetical protein